MNSGQKCTVNQFIGILKNRQITVSFLDPKLGHQTDNLNLYNAKNHIFECILVPGLAKFDNFNIQSKFMRIWIVLVWAEHCFNKHTYNMDNSQFGRLI